LIETASGEFRAYIKVLNARQLANELICTTLGRSVGLPIPEGVLLRVTEEELPDSTLLRGHVGEALIYGSIDVGFPSLKRRMKDDAGFLAILLNSWKEWDEATVFDEWIANPDRHAGNLLIETADKVWLIDHSHALTGPAWIADALEPSVMVRNQLADHFFRDLTLPDRMAVRKKTVALASLFELVDPVEAIEACRLDGLVSSHERDALIAFIRNRVTKLITLISSRLGIPDMGV
jgi:hypothetical protein